METMIIKGSRPFFKWLPGGFKHLFYTLNSIESIYNKSRLHRKKMNRFLLTIISFNIHLHVKVRIKREKIHMSND